MDQVNRFEVLGVRIDAVQIPEAVERIVNWVRSGDRGRYVVTANAHVVAEAEADPRVRAAIARADLCVPDGTPLRLVGRWLGYPLHRRVYGPELMEAVWKATAPLGTRHFLFGGSPGSAEATAKVLDLRYPGAVIAGAESPPFRGGIALEPAETLERIRRAAPDFLWVGLGAPKQDLWMYLHRGAVAAGVMIGVGAAFDFIPGRKSQAPDWMRENGLEWLFRLCTEPRRLWRRYLVDGGVFAARLAADWATGHWRRRPMASGEAR